MAAKSENSDEGEGFDKVRCFNMGKRDVVLGGVEYSAKSKIGIRIE